METANSKGGERPATSPCWKKKEPDAGFLDDVKDHLGQFVSTSMDQHRICLKKSIRGISDYLKLRKQRKVCDRKLDSILLTSVWYISSTFAFMVLLNPSQVSSSSASSSDVASESNSGSKNAKMDAS